MSINHLNIEQATSSIEVVSSSVIDKLYELALNPSLDSGSNVQGNLQVVHTYEDAVSYLLNKFPNLQINVTGGAYIRFADSIVQNICATNWGDGNGVTSLQLAVVQSIGTKFAGTAITSFNEFQKFTAITEFTQQSQFQNCSSLTEITLPPNFIGGTNISPYDDGAYQFRGCSKLINVKGAQSIQMISASAFKECPELVSIGLRDVTQIGEYAFFGDSLLSTIGDLTNVTVISQYAFRGCLALHIDINMPNLTELGASCLRETGIVSITSLGVITTLGEGYDAEVFRNCTNLETVILPTTLTSIGASHFAGCVSMRWIKMLPTSVISLSNDEVFSNTNNAPIYVPDDLVSSYQLATNWSTYRSRFRALSTFSADFPNG